MVKKKGKFCSRECYMEAVRNGFNKSGEDHPAHGKHWPEEMRQRISKSLMGKNHPRYGKQLLAEHRKKIGDANRGSKCWNWKGGITPFRTAIWRSEEYQDWRNAVFERDNYTCQMCGIRGGLYLHSHHLLPFKDYPEHRFDHDNGITLCRECHYVISSLHRRGIIFQPLPKIAAYEEKSSMKHSSNSVKPLRKRGNTEPSQPTLEGVETEWGASNMDEDTVQTTNMVSGGESHSW